MITTSRKLKAGGGMDEDSPCLLRGNAAAFRSRDGRVVLATRDGETSVSSAA
jgi:hypothetical protein